MLLLFKTPAGFALFKFLDEGKLSKVEFFGGRKDDWLWKSHSIGVFDLGSGSIGPTDSHDGYSDMFWPPPAWVCSNVSVEDGDVVLKRATEYGAVEIWMNERVRRACANSCADFLYGFLESSSKKGAEYWLIWRYEGEATLADLLQSKEFPYNVGTFLNQQYY